MAEAVVSTILEQLASIVRERVEEEVRLVVGVDEEVVKLNSNFLAIKSELEDAECKQVKEKAVGDWLDKLKDVSYDMEDVLDEWNTAIQKLRIMEAENASNASMLVTKVCSLMSCFRLCSRRVVIRHDIAKKIKDLNGALDVIAREKNSFHLSSIQNSTREVEWEKTTPVVDESEIHLRDDDEKEIKNLLLSESSNGPTSLPIISIVGLGGIGKTTLARQVFNDHEVTAHFNMKIWVCVSDPFDEMRIGKAILEYIRNEAPNLNEFATVLKNIHDSIKDKKFLLVLDNVWTKDSSKWKQLKNCLKHGSKESRVLVTTRDMKVAEVMGSTNFIEVKMLSDDKCWTLFSRISFSGRSREERQKLEDVGRRIVEKCKGLPLAVKTLAGLLCFKKTIDEWLSVLDQLDSGMWELEEAENKILAPLLISYFYLRSELKICFLYCAIFPKDYDISKEQLIQLWMAQDYLRSKVQNKDMELVGEEYFEKLTILSFFQDLKRDQVDGTITCKMHDMVHDLAQYLIKKECFNVEVDGEFRLNFDYEKARHSMIVLKGKASFSISNFYENRLRSLVFDCNYWDEYIDTSKSFDHLTCLRALHFGYDSIKDVPIGVNKLIHLRYLDISRNNDIKELPEAVCELYNLQTLNISFCKNLKKLPKEIGKLVNLRHLINNPSRYCMYIPKGIERLTCLRKLSSVFVSGDKKACKFECLRNLNHLGGSLVMTCSGVDMGEINKAEFKNKTKLLSLCIVMSTEYSGGYDGYTSASCVSLIKLLSNTNVEALEGFQPPPNLETLDLRGYRGDSRLSLNWMMSLTKLRKLYLNSWSHIGFERLSLAKLPFLESLDISEMRRVTSVGDEFVGMESDNISSSSSSSLVIAFPKLQSLRFTFLPNWGKWDCGASGRGEEQIKIMPCLRSLQIMSCSELQTLPDYLLQSTTLEELKFLNCSDLKTRYRVEEAENWVKDSGIPKIRIYDDLESSSPSVVSFHDCVEDELPETQIAIPSLGDDLSDISSSASPVAYNRKLSPSHRKPQKMPRGKSPFQSPNQRKSQQMPRGKSPFQSPNQSLGDDLESLSSSSLVADNRKLSPSHSDELENRRKIHKYRFWLC